jgi:hypothetical protein
MPSLAELPIADLRVAGDAVETVIEFRAYLPPGEMLVMVAGRFRDDIRELLRVPRLEPAHRGAEVKPLDSLESADLYRTAKAVGVLVGRFTPYIEDPELITLLSDLDELFRIRVSDRPKPREGARAL